MEKTTAKKTRKKVTKAEFKKAYMEKVLLTGHVPPSVFVFAKDCKATESDFYQFFNSFKTLEREIWLDWIEATLDILDKDPAYVEYSVRERLLAFYFTWLETLRDNRSFVLKSFEGMSKHELNPAFLESVKKRFQEYVEDLVVMGTETSEIANRPFSSNYVKAFWLHFIFITRFWVNDDSSGFEKTDAAIEKSVNVAFDLIGKGALDSILDFGKFMFQNR